jgi:hypothetical protein
MWKWEDAAVVWEEVLKEMSMELEAEAVESRPVKGNSRRDKVRYGL